MAALPLIGPPDRLLALPGRPRVRQGCCPSRQQHSWSYAGGGLNGSHIHGTWLQVQPDPGFRRYRRSFLCPSSSGLSARSRDPGFPFVTAAAAGPPSYPSLPSREDGAAPHTPSTPGPGAPPRPQPTPYAEGGEGCWGGRGAPSCLTLTQAQFTGRRARSRLPIVLLAACWAADREGARSGEASGVTLPGWGGLGSRWALAAERVRSRGGWHVQPLGGCGGVPSRGGQQAVQCVSPRPGDPLERVFVQEPGWVCQGDGRGGPSSRHLP